MTMQAQDLVAACALGVGATLSMDLWNLLLRRVFGVASLDYCLLGRWVAHMPRGVFRHDDIGAAGRVPRECGLGWCAHYTIGLTLAVGFVAFASPAWLARPTLLPPLAFGLATVLFPYTILQPAIGLGVAASKTKRPSRARLKSLATHTVFGLGLYLGALAMSRLPG